MSTWCWTTCAASTEQAEPEVAAASTTPAPSPSRTTVRTILTVVRRMTRETAWTAPNAIPATAALKTTTTYKRREIKDANVHPETQISRDSSVFLCDRYFGHTMHKHSWSLLAPFYKILAPPLLATVFFFKTTVSSMIWQTPAVDFKHYWYSLGSRIMYV